MNKIIAIGYLSDKKCYLNIDRDVAIQLYCESEDMTREEFEYAGLDIQEITFDSIFGAYHIWE